MDVSQHGVAVPNNRGVNDLICKFLETPFLCYCHLILLQPKPSADCFWVSYCFRSATKIKPDNILQLVGEGKMTLFFKRMLIMIRFLTCSKKLSRIYECHYNGKRVKLHGLKLILLYYLAHIASVLVLSNFWWSVPVLSVVYRR